MITYLKKWTFGIVTTISLMALFMIVSSTITHGSWFVDDEILRYHNFRPPLEVTFTPNSTSNFQHLNQTGGVALILDAQPDVSLSFDEITLDYDPSAEDGNRLAIMLDGMPVDHYLPDWMLIPIANYADSEYNAVVSLFGPETEYLEEEETYRYDIIFHPALHNTLLGLRLMQSDMMFIKLYKFWRLPEWVEDNSPPVPYSGLGEVIPPMSDNATHWIAPNNEMVQTFQDSQSAGETFQSWVLTDIGQEVRFDVVGNELQLTGQPYYYFWNADFSPPQDPEVFEIVMLTENMRSKWDPNGAINQYNPFVYNAVIQTMRYAAFFRYIKGHYPNTWNLFIAEIENVPLDPDILTPTTWLPCITSTSTTRVHLTQAKVFPNPVSDVLNIEVKGDLQGDVQIRILSFSGQQMLREYNSSINDMVRHQTDVSDLPAGTYIIEVSDGNAVAVGQFIKH